MSGAPFWQYFGNDFGRPLRANVRRALTSGAPGSTQKTNPPSGRILSPPIGFVLSSPLLSSFRAPARASLALSVRGRPRVS